MKIGDIVRDKNPSYDDGVCVVIKDTNERADEVMVEEVGRTVSQLNPDSRSDSEVVEVVFKTKLDYNIPEWWMKSKEGLYNAVTESGLKIYKYPKDGLEPIENGMFRGVKINLVGVADPLKYKRGAYNFSIENSDISYSQSNDVENHDKVTKTIAYIEGLLDSLEWLDENLDVEGIQFVLEDGSIEQKIQGNVNVQNEDEISLIHKFKSAIDQYEKVEFRTVRRKEIENVAQKAIEKYEERESTINKEFDVDKVVGDEFLVDGVYSVNISQETCTCDANGICDHIKYVQRIEAE